MTSSLRSSPKRFLSLIVTPSFLPSSLYVTPALCRRYRPHLSATGIWKRSVVSCRNGFPFAPHWSLSFAYEGNLYFMGKTSILVYDPHSNKGDTLDYPDASDRMNIMSFGFLGSTCGKLRIADIGHYDLRIWEMIEGEYWELVHHVNFSAYLPARLCANYFKRVGGFHPNDGDIVYLYSYADGVFAANLAEMKFTAIPGL